MQALLERLEAWQGASIDVAIALTFDVNRNFDRHCTTTHRMRFGLEHVGMMFSGARLVFMGPAPLQFEVFVDYLGAPTVHADSVELTEVLAAPWVRRTTVRRDA